jgi:tripeptidyl-peptidase-1
MLNELSADPHSSQYSKHWSHEDVRKAFQPGESVIEDVQSWLNISGISGDQLQASLYQGKLVFTATATQASSLFQSNFSRYHHTQSDSYAVGCEAYSIPSHLVQHIDFVTPTIGHEPPSARAAVPSRPSKSRRQVGVRQARAATAYSNFSTCYEAAFPGCISMLYNITPFTGNPRADNMMGIFNTLELGLNESYSQADLDAFFTTFAPSIRNGTHPSHASVDGGVVEVQNPMYEGSEAMLDYSIALPIIYPQEIKAFVTNDGYTPSDSSTYPKNTGIQSFLDAIDADICKSNGAQKHASLDCGKYKPTNVISISYGAFEYTIGKKYAKRVCNEFMKLGLQGVTVLLPAGDYNVGPEYSCGGENLNVFIPEWLATCPWVTTVGGTEIPYETDILNKTQPSEIGWHVTPTFGGGGGFSNYYKMPAYQKKAVEGYLDTANLSFASYSQFANASGYVDLGAGTNGIFNRAGRAYPDVSALANEIAVSISLLVLDNCS